jgi:hypothetical protein
MPRRVARAACAGALLAGFAIGLGPGLSGAAPVSAATVAPAVPAGSGARLILRTVPVLRGVRVVLDGRSHSTNAHGRVVIAASAGPHHVHILPPRTGQASYRVQFARWLDGFASAYRTLTLSPGTNNIQAGFVVSRPIAVRFTDEHGRPVPMSEVSRLTVGNSVGQRFTFAPADPPRVLPANRVVRDQAGLVLLPIRYSVREAVIDQSNVVYGGSQSFFVTPGKPVWTIKVLLFPLRIEVRDALFGFPIGSAVKLILPSHADRLVSLGPDHSVLLTGLPRATYQIVAKGLGVGLTSPTTLSKPQTAKVLLFSWIDVSAVLGFIVLFLIGLPLVGGRLRRRGRSRLPVWHGGGTARQEQPSPAEAGGGSVGASAGPPERPRPTATSPAFAAPVPAPDGPPQPRPDDAGPEQASDLATAPARGTIGDQVEIRGES